jgi:hypothetical protein
LQGRTGRLNVLHKKGQHIMALQLPFLEATRIRGFVNYASPKGTSQVITAQLRYRQRRMRRHALRSPGNGSAKVPGSGRGMNSGKGEAAAHGEQGESGLFIMACSVPLLTPQA